MLVEPSDERDVISLTPAMEPSTRSSGVDTVAAMVSGLAPGSDALTEMVGKSTCGSGAIGSNWNASAPAKATPRVISVVATGRAMNGAEMFKPCLHWPAVRPRGARARPSSCAPGWHSRGRSPAW